MALSRLKLGFESRWGQHNTRARWHSATGLVVFLALPFFGCPSSAERSLQQGHQLAKKSQWAQASSAYAAAAAAEPSSAQAHALVGVAQLRLGDGAQAASAFDRALALEPTSAPARLGLAGLALAERDAGAAIAWVEPLSTATASAVRSRALLLRGGEGDAEAALVEARAALTLEPDHLEARYLEGSALLALSRYAEAQSRFEDLERLARQSPFGAYGLARLAAAQRRSTDVLLYLKAARAAARDGWRPADVAADPAFAFLVGSPAFTDVVGP